MTDSPTQIPTSPQDLHLICNAHLDPVWLWHWEDGATEAISTFRVAAEFCESYPDFVFNHNEAVLYEWVETHDPDLFKRIRDLVKAGRWHVSGGAWLQPDINAPHGEAHIRQYLLGLNYFKSRFGVRPRDAYNFDSFGHTEGFPQILRGCGMESYIFCRPMPEIIDLPVGPFVWKDRSGSGILACRLHSHYNASNDIESALEKWLPFFEKENRFLFPWGIGNHGGGPSRVEWEYLNSYKQSHPEMEMLQSTPENFFSAVEKDGNSVPEICGEMQNCYAGCYTSMNRVKKTYRQVEHLVMEVERLSALAWWRDLMPYPSDILESAWKDVLFVQFHDILPGSGAPQVEADALQQLHHAGEEMRRLRLRCLLLLLQDEPKARPGDTPVFIVNPHPFRLRTQVEFEYNTAHKPPEEGSIVLRDRSGKRLPFQQIKEDHNAGGNWRLRMAASVNLPPWELYRIDAEYQVGVITKKNRLPTVKGKSVMLQSSGLTIQINTQTGLVDRVQKGRSEKCWLQKNAFQPLLFKDLDHSWTCGNPEELTHPDVDALAPAWKRPDEGFRLARPDEVSLISPDPAEKWDPQNTGPLQPVRWIEDGPVRSVVEVIFVCGPSQIIRHYILLKKEGMLEIRDRVFYNHRDHMLKLDIPLAFEPRESLSESTYSVAVRQPTETYAEVPNQRWIAVRGKGGMTVSVVNDGSFGHSFTSRGPALNLLRSPAYASFNLKHRNDTHVNRFIPRQDQGEHTFRFRVMFMHRFNEEIVQKEAALFNMQPHWQVFHPGKEGASASYGSGVTCEASGVLITAVKKAENEDSLVVRFQEVDGQAQETHVRVEGVSEAIPLPMGAYELKTLLIPRDNPARHRYVNLVEGI